MPVNLTMTTELEDAVAYEYFMDTVDSCLKHNDGSADEIYEDLMAVAKASYLIAGVFMNARTAYYERKQALGKDSLDEEPVLASDVK